VGPLCGQIVDDFLELGEVGLFRMVIFSAPPFNEFGVPLVGRIGESLAELLITPWTTDVLERAAPGCLEQYWLGKSDYGEGALDLDAVRPPVAEVVKVLQRFCAGVFDCR
jgi:hypothetical protein